MNAIHALLAGLLGLSGVIFGQGMPPTRPSVRGLFPHGAQRGTDVEIDGIVQPAPAPRFSRTVPDLPMPPQPPSRGEEAEAALAAWLEPTEITALRTAGTLG